jgi:hypothetical protein
LSTPSARKVSVRSVCANRAASKNLAPAFAHRRLFAANRSESSSFRRKIS